MKHPVYRVEAFEIVAPYTLNVTFDDHTTQLIDFQPVLAGQLYGPLRDLAVFNQVTLDPEVHTLVWPNGADFDPTTLHDWPRYVRQFQRMTRTWKKNSRSNPCRLQNFDRQTAQLCRRHPRPGGGAWPAGLSTL